MIIKYTKLYLLPLLLLTGLFACKKEIVTEATRFGFLNVDNQTTYKDLLISYNGTAMTNTSPDPYHNIKVPEGTGKLAFKDKSGKDLLETNFSIEAHKTKNLLLFQPVPDLKPVILENNQAEEPKPEKDYIKVKVANFAVNSFKKPIDLIFYYADPVTGEQIEFGTIENLHSEFKEYKKLHFPSGQSLDDTMAMIVDHETKEPLLDWYIFFTPTPAKSSVFTFYIKEGTEGSQVIGTPYFVNGVVLFAN